MADVTLSDELAQQLQKLAHEEGRPLDDVVRSMLEQYQPTVVDYPSPETADETNNPLLGLIGLLDRYTDT
jgi:predicted DNA-binding protein